MQIALRNNVLVIDIESLSTKEERQIPYMICGVGYLSVYYGIFYRSWTNKDIQTYQKG